MDSRPSLSEDQGRMSVVAVISVVAVVVAAVSFTVAAYVRRWHWTGFVGSPDAGQPAKTLWDWLQLFVIPLGLAAVAFGLNLAQSSREQHREDRRAERERRIATDQRREDVLAAYLRQMTGLHLQGGARNARERSEARSMGRTLTLSVLRRLDGRRKGFVLQFLSEGRLSWFANEPQFSRMFGMSDTPKVDLTGADLRGAVVHDALTHVNLNGVDLRNADFRGAQLGSVSLVAADVRAADFSTAHVSFLSFQAADLRGASFRRATVVRADFRGACMTGARLAGARLRRSRLRNASGHDVDLSGATLEETDLWHGWLADINVSGARFVGGRPPDPSQDPAQQDPDCVKAA
jgi:uncharacterized protein YjbI with pentapeptide repeats